MKKFKSLLNMAMNTKNTMGNDNDNYYLDSLIKQLRYECLCEESFNSIFKSYMKETKRQTPDLIGYYESIDSMIITNNFSIINILDTKQRQTLIKTKVIKKHQNSIDNILESFKKIDKLKLDFDSLDINIFDLKENSQYFLQGDYKYNIDILYTICKIHKEMNVKLYINDDNYMFVTNGINLFGVILPCIVNGKKKKKKENK